VTSTDTAPLDSGASEVPIADYLCLALYSASRAVTGLYRELLDPLGLTYPQYLVMRVLWERGPVPVKEIAGTLQLDYGTLSPLLKRLEAAGLVHRERRPDDERSVEITLTDAGDTMRHRAATVPSRMGSALGLPEAELHELRAALTRLIAAIAAGKPHGDA
jgi:DNA-binding MarR family transcriptional regulator